MLGLAVYFLPFVYISALADGSDGDGLSVVVECVEDPYRPDFDASDTRKGALERFTEQGIGQKCGDFFLCLRLVRGSKLFERLDRFIFIHNVHTIMLPSDAFIRLLLREDLFGFHSPAKTCHELFVRENLKRFLPTVKLFLRHNDDERFPAVGDGELAQTCARLIKNLVEVRTRFVCW